MSAPLTRHLASAADLQSAFGDGPDFLVGIEDEVMLLDPESLELAPRSAAVLAVLEGDARFKPELPAAQLEIITSPAATVGDAAAQLLEARRELSDRTQGLVRLAGAGVHPLSSGQGQLNQLERYEHTIVEYGPVAERQLVCASQIHVSLTGSDRVLAVYNAARAYLPLLAALGANSVYYEGRDSGLASVRSKLCDLLPRQGVPPSLSSWQEYADALAWGQASGRFDVGQWWWELRPHPRVGSLEFRVPDAQATVADVAAVAAVAQSLVAWLSARYEAGACAAPVPAWLIEENRWSACRHGVEGSMADLMTGREAPTRDRLEELLKRLKPFAAQLGCEAELDDARRLGAQNGALLQRSAGAQGGARAVARFLVNRFLDPVMG